MLCYCAVRILATDHGRFDCTIRCSCGRLGGKTGLLSHPFDRLDEARRSTGSPPARCMAFSARHAIVEIWSTVKPWECVVVYRAVCPHKPPVSIGAYDQVSIKQRVIVVTCAVAGRAKGKR